MYRGFEAFTDIKKSWINLQKEHALEEGTQTLSYLHFIKVGCRNSRQIKEFSP